jgi:Lon protease-like protein
MNLTLLSDPSACKSYGVVCASVEPKLLPNVPVFPLPETVLFPGIVLPLQVFEPPYRDMIRDALRADRSVAIAMMRPGGEKMERPPVCDVGCAARIIHADRQDDGQYNILLHGIHRIRFVQELCSDRPYRCFSAEVIPKPTEEALLDAAEELAKLQSCVLSLANAVVDKDEQLVEVLRATSDPVELIDILCAVLVSEPIDQQELLAMVDLRARLVRLIDSLAEVMLRLGEPSKAAQLN